MICIPRTYFRLSTINRNFHTTAEQCKEKTALMRQVNVMRKLLGNKESGSKKRWYPNEEATSQITSVRDIGKVKRQGKNATRRVNVLNKLFMKHITDQLATGAISEEILGKGLEISRVKVASDFFGVNVFWIAKGACTDNEIEQSLHKCSGILRHELSQLRLMGEVPRIYFVKDKTYANLAEVENILRDCDFGDDFEETDCSDQLRNELSISNFECTDGDDDLPLMRHDVLGLNHKEILTGILVKMKKSKDAWELFQTGSTELPPGSESVESATPKLDAIEKRLNEIRLNDEGFQKYLLARNFKKETPERKKPIKILETRFDSSHDEEYLSRSKMDDDDFIEEVDSKKS